MTTPQTTARRDVTVAPSAATTAPGHHPRNTEMLLIFRLSGEAFALSVNSVFEILDAIPATRVPNAPDYVRDLINVRGTIAPLLDLRRRLNMPRPEREAGNRIIVLELPVAGQATRLAILADGVDEVIEVDSSCFEPIPELGARWPEAFIRGVCTHRGTLVVMLEPETLFAPDGLAPLHT